MDFPYHRSLAPMMWVLVALGCCELLVVHILVALWSRPVALILSAISFASVIGIVRLIRSFRRLPVRIGDEHLVMRSGSLRRIDIPLTEISGLRTHWDAAALKDRSLLNLAMIAYPNVVVELRSAIPSSGLGSRPVQAVAHRLDDSGAFTVAIRQLVQPDE